VVGTSFTGDMAIDDISLTCSSCINTVSTYPYSEDFETGTGLWINAAGDNFDWTRDDLGTTSTSTGPTTGNGASTWYMYTETSSPRLSGEIANFESPCFDLSACTASDITFAYHMYGATTGSLFLEVEATPGSGTWTSIWSLSGDQGNVWSSATVSLLAYAGTTIKLRFRGVVGTSFTGDLAIDDIVVSCSSSGCAPNGLTTFYATDNGQDGIMFDVVATTDITVVCFDSNWDPGTYDAEIYYKTGTHVGFEVNAAAWTLVGSTTGAVSNGNDIASPVPINISVPIAAGQTVAFYITNTGIGSVDKNYTNGTVVGALLASNANLSILEGTGKAYPFGTNYIPRQFNGTIYYTTTPLPVKLMSFTVSCEGSSNLLEWSTASELNNDRFIVQKSVDAVEFDDVMEVTGNGTSNVMQSYSVYVESTNNIEYYRLKQLDYDGSVEFSDIVTSNCDVVVEEIAIYPNPVNDILHVDISSNGGVTNLEIFDLVGNRVFSSVYNCDYGLNQVDIDLSYLSAGVYSISISGEKINPYVSKVIKK